MTAAHMRAIADAAAVETLAEVRIQRVAELLAAHEVQVGGGGGLWNAKCLGCRQVASGAGTMLDAIAANHWHVAEALAAAGLLADP